MELRTNALEALPNVDPVTTDHYRTTFLLGETLRNGWYNAFKAYALRKGVRLMEG